MRTAAMAMLLLAGCSGAGSGNEVQEPANGILPPGPVTNGSDISADALPKALTELIRRSVPGMRVAEAERKEREGRVYYDVEGTRPDGSEIELDILQEGETYRLVEIQRDLKWEEVPAAAQAAAKARPDAFVPARVIESTQPDGAIIYELFASGKPGEPAMEVQVKGGKAGVLGERSAH